MESSLIIFDIDGTLLDHDKKLPESTKRAVKLLKENGHVVAIATGRGPFMYENLRNELGIETYISFNGQYVVHNGKVVYKNPITEAALEKLTEYATSNQHPLVYQDHEKMRANVEDHHYVNESIASLKIDSFPHFEENYFKNKEILQSHLLCREGEEEFYIQAFPDLYFIRWHEFSMDVLPAGGSKANGIKQLMNYLNMNEDQVYAFGDGLNDIEMLAFVKNSYAMGNAEEKVKQAARFVTKDVDKNGIFHGLVHAGLLDEKMLYTLI